MQVTTTEKRRPSGILALILFNICIGYTILDLPSMISRQYAKADYLALPYSSGDWKDLEGSSRPRQAQL